MSYTIKQALDVIRAIKHHLIDVDVEHELLRKVGPWRKNGTPVDAQEIIDKIFAGKAIDGYQYFNYTDAVKMALRDNILLAKPTTGILSEDAVIQSAELVKFEQMVNGLDASESPAKDAAEGVFNFIRELVDSGDVEKMHVAEILYTLMHMCYVTAHYSDENKMVPSNLGLTPLGPIFTNNFQLCDDPMKLIAMNSAMARVASEALSYIPEDDVNPFAMPFEATFGEVCFANRQRSLSDADLQLAATERMRLAQEATLIKILQEIEDEKAAMLRTDSCLDLLATKRKHGQMKRSEYKEAKKQTQDLKENSKEQGEKLQKRRVEVKSLLKTVLERKHATESKRDALRSSFDHWRDVLAMDVAVDLQPGPQAADPAEMRPHPSVSDDLSRSSSNIIRVS